MHKESLESYRIALHFFSCILQNAPDEKLFHTIIEQDLFDSFFEWECFATPPKLSGAFKDISPSACIASLSKKYTKEKSNDDFLAELKAVSLDHLTLFSGPSPVSPPWESVWREKAQLLFGEQTQKVASLYTDWGISINNEKKEPEDHLGYELSFICFLLQKIKETSISTEIKQSAKNTLISFLEEHVLMWAGSCLEKASTSAKTVFYAENMKLCFVAIINLFENITSQKI